jgi:hypothetical protein
MASPKKKEDRLSEPQMGPLQFSAKSHELKKPSMRRKFIGPQDSIARSRQDYEMPKRGTPRKGDAAEVLSILDEKGEPVFLRQQKETDPSIRTDRVTSEMIAKKMGLIIKAPPRLNIDPLRASSRLSSQDGNKVKGSDASRPKETEPQKADPTNPSFADLVNSEYESLRLEKGQELEAELSFGSYLKGGFAPGVNSRSFENVRIVLEAMSQELYIEVHSSKSIINIAPGEPWVKGKTPQERRAKKEFSKTIREVTVFNKSGGEESYYFETKNRYKHVEGYVFGTRLSFSIEEEVDPPKKFVPTLRRVRDRTRYDFGEENLRVDLTRVVTTMLENGKEVSKPLVTYEVEIEILDGVDNTFLDSLIRGILMAIDDVDDFEKIITTDLMKALVAEHNFLCANVVQERETQKKVVAQNFLSTSYLSKPINFKLLDLVDHRIDYAITSKYDGERRVLLVFRQGTFCISRGKIWRVGDVAASTKLPMVIDTEFVVTKEFPEGVYHGFDCLVYEGKNVMARKLEERLMPLNPTLQGILSKALWNPGGFGVKKYYFPDQQRDIYDCTNVLLKDQQKDTSIGYDGIIYQPTGTYFEKPKKWKPMEMMTIDFYLEDSSGGITYKLMASNHRLVPFKKFYQASEIGKYVVYDEDVVGDVSSMLPIVAECSFDPDANTFRVVRLRPDRGMNPNEAWVANSVWSDIVNPIPVESILGKDLAVMRRLHNQHKILMLQRLRGSKTLLDIGTGQGGDLQKWQDLGLKKIYSVEPSDAMHQKMTERYENLKNSLDYDIISVRDKKGNLVGGENTRAITRTMNKHNDERVDGAAAFFSLTFFGKGEDMLDELVETFSSTLTKNKSRLVGIVLDGERTKELLNSERSTKEGKKRIFNTPEFSIETTGKTQEVGGKTSLQIVTNIKGSEVIDVKEWTFPFELFANKMRKKGFTLSSTGFLDEFGGEQKDRFVERGFIEAPLPEKVAFATAPEFKKLPPSSYEFSRLNRYFVFTYRHRGVEAVISQVHGVPYQRFKSQKIAGVDITNEKESYFLAVDVPQDNGALLHAVLFLVLKEYREGSRKQRDKIVKSIRECVTEEDLVSMNIRTHFGSNKDFIKYFNSGKLTHRAGVLNFLSKRFKIAVFVTDEKGNLNGVQEKGLPGVLLYRAVVGDEDKYFPIFRSPGSDDEDASDDESALNDKSDFFLAPSMVQKFRKALQTK